MAITLGVADCWDLLQVHQLWAKYWQPRFSHGHRVQWHHMRTCQHGCPYFQIGCFRVCKDSGNLWVGSPHVCVPEKCPTVLAENADRVCSIAGTRWAHVCDPALCPQIKSGEFMVCSLTGTLFDRELSVEQHFFEWCSVKKSASGAATTHTQVVKRIKDAMYRRTYDLLDQMGCIQNEEEVATCIASVFFHSGIPTTQYKCFVGAMMRVFRSPHSDFSLPVLKGELRDLREWPRVLGVKQNAITQMEKTVRQKLVSYRFTNTLDIPHEVRNSPEKYLHI